MEVNRELLWKECMAEDTKCLVAIGSTYGSFLCISFLIRGGLCFL